MSTLRGVLPRTEGPAVTAGAAGLGITAGLAAVSGLVWTLVLLAMLLFIAAFAVGLLNWRWSVLGLMLYIPISGIPIVALYPHTQPGVLAKDFLFVLPAYAGFFGTWISERKQIQFPGAPTLLILILGVLVLLGTLNPDLPSPVVGLVGVKVWLLYIPLLYVGYHYLRTIEDLEFTLKVLALSAVVPAVIGIIEALLLYSGQKGFVYGLYGAAAGPATQSFAEVNVGGTSLLRVPSTFSFVVQYYTFTISMVAMTYAWWRMGSVRGGGSPLRLALFGLLLIACFTSGARGAFVFLPALMVFLLILDGQFGSRLAGLAAGGAAAFLLATMVIGLDVTALGGALWQNADTQFDIIFVKGWHILKGALYAGYGTGIDAVGARYVIDPTDKVGNFGPEGGFQEAYWMRAILELGVAGLIVSVALYGTLIVRLGQRTLRMRDPGLRAFAAAATAIVLWGVMYNFKAQYIDLDPLNVYLWLFSGMAFRAFILDREQVPPDGAETHAAPS